MCRVQADCFLSRRFNGGSHRTRRKKIRKTTDVFCALSRYFIGDSRIASPTPTFVASFAAALFNSDIRFPRSLSPLPVDLAALLRAVTTFSAVLLHGIPRRTDIPSLLELYSRLLTLYELSGNPLIPRRSSAAKVQHIPPPCRARQLTR